jgi:pilus assembly protein CpaB
MRAVSTEISAETGAGGFILPNDRVDIVLTRRLKNPDGANNNNNGQTGGNDLILSEVILTNIRVLAIDQAPKEKDGQNAVLGKTVTLELRPDQVATLSASRQGGTLTLALRSIADANASDGTAEDQALKRPGGVNVIRYGVQARQLTSQK